MIRQEMERIWRELPCIYPSHVCRWKIEFRPLSALAFWMEEGFKGILFACKGRFYRRRR